MNARTGEFQIPCARRKYRIGLQCVFSALLLVCVENSFGAAEMFDPFPGHRGTQTGSKRQGEPRENMSCGDGHGVGKFHAAIFYSDYLLP